MHETLRVPIATHVHADTRVAVARQIRVGEGVAHDGAVALTVG